MTVALITQSASVWQVQDAKSRLAELISRAGEIGPQTITRHGKPVAVVISPEAAELVEAKLRPNFGEFLLTAPKLESAETQLLQRPRHSRRRAVTFA